MTPRRRMSGCHGGPPRGSIVRASRLLRRESAVIGRRAGTELVRMDGPRRISAVRMRRPRPRGRMDVAARATTVDRMADPLDRAPARTPRRGRRWLEWLYALGPVVALILLGAADLRSPTIREPSRRRSSSSSSRWPPGGSGRSRSSSLVSVGALLTSDAVAGSLDRGDRGRPGQLHGRRTGRRPDALGAGRHRRWRP